MLYPIFFIIIDRFIPKLENKQRFLHINYFIHLLAGVISVLLFWISGINLSLQLSGLVYLSVIIVVVFYYWNPPLPLGNLFIASLIFGFIVFVRAIREIVQLTPLWHGVLMGVISTGIITSTTFLFVLILRNKNKKNIELSIVPILLKGLIILIGLRTVWDIFILFSVKIGDQNNIFMSVYQFFIQNDIVYFLSIIVIGLIFPLILISVWMKLLKKSSKKTILMFSIILLTAVWLGEFLYKYFLLQYGIVL